MSTKIQEEYFSCQCLWNSLQDHSHVQFGTYLFFSLKMKQSNTDFKVSVKILQKEFLCNICFNEIQDCYITRCGHIYCKQCIYQSINRHHRCPFCNVGLGQNDVFKNYHFNTLRKIVTQQKEAAASEYLSTIFKEQQLAEDDLMAPVEKQILNTFQQTLLIYRKYVTQVFRSLQVNEEKKALDAKLEYELKTPRQLIQQIHKSILPHLQTPIISPLLIPAVVSVTMDKYTLKLELNSMTPVSQIVYSFQKLFKQHNIRLQYGQTAKVTLGDITFGLADTIGEHINTLTGNVIMKWENIHIIKNIECYTYKWHKGRQIDYYSCKDCSVNWICVVCKDYCHQKHQCTLQLKDHIPNWACCYCVTKCDCKALNKNKE